MEQVTASIFASMPATPCQTGGRITAETANVEVDETFAALHPPDEDRAANARPAMQ